MSIVDRYFFRKSSTANMQYDFLDGLRGVAVLFVLLSHLGMEGADPIPGLSFFGSGKYGVFLFFVLSAFLLSLPLLRLPANGLGNRRLWLNYAVRRCLRIFPLFTLVLVVSYLFADGGYVIPLSGAELKQHLLLRQGKSIFWTIPVEFKYYIVLPFMVLLLVVPLRRNLVASAAMLAVVLLLIEGWLWPARDAGINSVALGPYLPIFLLGSFAALLHQRLLERPWTRSAAVRRSAEVGAFLLLLVAFALVPEVSAWVFGKPVPSDRFHQNFLLFGSLWSAFIVLCFLGTGILRRLLAAPPIRFLGIISFSAYLWHMPVIHLVTTLNMPPVLRGWAGLALILAVSSLSYLMIERPFLRLRIPWKIPEKRPPEPRSMT